MGDLKGRDVNGMRSAPWGKLDTSAISKIKVPENCTLVQFFELFKKILIIAINLLYGSNKDKKYIKITDMIMMRNRGDLEEFFKQIQKENESNSKKSSIEDITQQLLDKLNVIINEQDSKTQENYKNNLQKINDAVKQALESNIQKDINNSDKNVVNQKNQNEETQQSATGFDLIKDQVFSQDDLSTQQFQILEDLQKSITENFSKIENLITSNSVQKNAEVAAAQMNKPVEQQIIDKQKNNENQIKEQIQSINQKTGPEVKHLGEDEKDEKKADKERKKKREKQKKNDLKNVMTGRQFGQLKKLLIGQFYDVIETSDIVVKKVNKGFKAINKRLDKIIKDRIKNGFSWTKLIVFLSLFLIPVLFPKLTQFITDFLKKLIITFDINKIIDDFINKIDWLKHINKITGGLWDSIQKKFDTFISDPMKAMINLTKNVFNSCVAFVKELWQWVTGAVGSDAQKKQQKAHEKKMKEDEKRLNQAIERSEKANEASIEEVSYNANAAAKTSMKDVKKTVDDTKASVEKSQNDIQSKIVKSNQISDQANAALKGMSDKAIQQTGTSVNKSLKNVDSTVQNVVTKESKNIEQQAKANMESLEKNGSPTTLKPADVERMENSDGLLEGADVSKLQQLPTPLDGLQNVTADVNSIADENAYSQVNFAKPNMDLDKRGANGVAVPNDELKDLIVQNSGRTNSDMVERLQNRAVFGQYVGNDSVSYTNAWKEFQVKKQNKQVIADRRDKLADKLTGKTTKKDEISLSDALNKASEIYSNIDNAFKVVVNHSSLIETGLNENKKQLTLLKSDVKNYFDKVNEIASNMKPIIKNNTKLAVMPSPKLDNDTMSAQMK